MLLKNVGKLVSRHPRAAPRFNTINTGGMHDSTSFVDHDADAGERRRVPPLAGWYQGYDALRPAVATIRILPASNHAWHAFGRSLGLGRSL